MNTKSILTSLNMEVYDEQYRWVKKILKRLDDNETDSLKNTSLSTEEHDTLKESLRKYPKETLRALLANKALLRLPDKVFDVVVTELSNELSFEANAWKKIREKEAFLWREVNVAIEKLEKNNPLNITETLCWMILWFEEFRWEKWDCNNESTFEEWSLSHTYSTFISYYLPMILKRSKSLNDLDPRKIDKFLNVTKEGENPIAPILQAICEWSEYYEGVVLFYCFDETSKVTEEGGETILSQSAEDYKSWRRDGDRYEALKNIYLLKSIDFLKSNYLMNFDNFEIDEKERLSPNNMAKACELLMEDAHVRENELSIYTNLQRWSNRRRETYTDKLKEFKIKLPKGSRWIDAMGRLYIQSYLKGITILPYELHSREDFQRFMSDALQSDNDSDNDFISWLPQISYTVKADFEFNRFKPLMLDFSRKPFLHIEESGLYFSPMLFFGTIDWTIQAPANWLNYLKLPKNEHLQRTHSEEMEEALYKHLKKNLYDLVSIQKTEQGKSSLSKEGDVDILLEDSENILLIQVKCSTMRLTIEEAYNERLQAERKAVKQLVKAQSSFLSKGKKIIKWMVSTSYEHCNQILDEDVRKVSYWDIVALCSSMNQYIGEKMSFSDFVNKIENDFVLDFFLESAKYNMKEYRIKL